jgi:hypothetical protein
MMLSSKYPVCGVEVAGKRVEKLLRGEAKASTKFGRNSLLNKSRNFSRWGADSTHPLAILTFRVQRKADLSSLG